MPNDYFQFKHFRVQQDRCAMKVCTDACILGATADLTGASRILDIGTGTGLLALMAAQRHSTACIEAVEIEADAAAQATENVAASPWAGRIQVHACSLADYAATRPAPFDYILCNPPFFRSSLRSADAARTTARHTAPDTLSFEELAHFAGQHLTPTGRLTVLLPPVEMLEFEREAGQSGLYPIERLVTRHRAGSRPLRHISVFGHDSQPLHEQELVIHEAQGPIYTPAFRALLTDFYLAF